MLIKVDGGGGRERAEGQGLRGDARVDDFQVGGDRLRPLVDQDAGDGRGPEGSCEGEVLRFEGRKRGRRKRKGGS